MTLPLDLNFYLSVPWTILREEHDDDGNYAALTISELPGFVVASEDEAELETMYWEVLESFLRSYLDAGERPPLPGGVAAGIAKAEEVIARHLNAAPDGTSPGSSASSLPLILDGGSKVQNEPEDADAAWAA